MLCDQLQPAWPFRGRQAAMDRFVGDVTHRVRACHRKRGVGDLVVAQEMQLEAGVLETWTADIERVARPSARSRDRGYLPAEPPQLSACGGRMRPDDLERRPCAARHDRVARLD